MRIEKFVENIIAAQKAVDKIIDEHNKRKDDTHHCCGRYIKNKADRQRHDELFHHEHPTLKVPFQP